METRAAKASGKRRHDVSLGPPAEVMLLETPELTERKRLEALSDERLKEEVRRDRLEEQATREAAVELIFAHMEQNSPMADMLSPVQASGPQAQSGSRPAAPPGASATTEDATVQALEKLTAAVMMCVQQQHQIWQRMGECSTGPLVQGPISSSGESSSSRGTDSRGQVRSSVPQEPAWRGDRCSYGGPSSVAVLLPQIPEFGGEEKDSILM